MPKTEFTDLEGRPITDLRAWTGESLWKKAEARKREPVQLSLFAWRPVPAALREIFHTRKGFPQESADKSS